MTTGEINDVNVIAEASTICGVIIITVDIKFREFSGGNFHDVWHEVIRDAVRVLAE